MVRVTATFREQNAAVTRNELRAYQAYCTGNLEIRWNSKVRRIFDHLATVQISVFEFQNTREYILLLLLPLKLKGLSGKQLPKRWSLRGMLCSGRSFEMLISLAGELQKTSRQLMLMLIFLEGIKSMSLLLSLNLMGSGSGGR